MLRRSLENELSGTIDSVGVSNLYQKIKMSRADVGDLKGERLFVGISISLCSRWGGAFRSVEVRKETLRLTSNDSPVTESDPV